MTNIGPESTKVETEVMVIERNNYRSRNMSYSRDHYQNNYRGRGNYSGD